MSKAIRSSHRAGIRVFGLVVGLLAGGSGFARAQAPAAAPTPPAAAGAAKPAWIVACEGDLGKFCAAEVKANSDVRPCLAKNEAGLSATCKDVFLRKYKIIELCKGDFEKLCPGITGGRALTSCLNEKADQVSDKCKSAMTRGTKQFKKEEAASDKAAAKADKAAAKADKTTTAKDANAAKKTATP
jgi:hypothetical protein